MNVDDDYDYYDYMLLRVLERESDGMSFWYGLFRTGEYAPLFRVLLFDRRLEEILFMGRYFVCVARFQYIYLRLYFWGWQYVSPLLRHVHIRYLYLILWYTRVWFIDLCMTLMSHIATWIFYFNQIDKILFQQVFYFNKYFSLNFKLSTWPYVPNLKFLYSA
jgi:hypothetical protein